MEGRNYVLLGQEGGAYIQVGGEAGRVFMCLTYRWEVRLVKYFYVCRLVHRIGAFPELGELMALGNDIQAIYAAECICCSERWGRGGGGGER